MSFGSAFASGAGSAIGGAAGNIIDQFINFGFGEWASAKSYARQKKILKNRIQWAVQDMEAAGINPLLAVTGGIPSGGASAPMGVTGRSDTLGAMAAAKQVALLDAERDKAVSEKIRNLEEAELKFAQRFIAQAQAKLTEGEVDIQKAAIASAKGAQELYEKWPWLRQAHEIIQTLSPFIPRTHGGVGYYYSPVREGWSHETERYGKGWMTRTRRSGKGKR